MRGTALQIVQQACGELGLPVPTEGVTSQEQTTIQMLALLNSCGNELLNWSDWQFLIRTHDIVTDGISVTYPRPADFNSQINQTIWDKGMKRALRGPLSPQQWAFVKNRAISTGPFIMYRINNDMVELNPNPGIDSINYEYVSNGWVQTYDDPLVYRQMIQNDLDIITYEFWMMVKFLKMRMWEAKGLDASSLKKEFDTLYDAITGQDQGAPILTMSPRPIGMFISVNNIPDGSWNTGT